MGKDQRYIGGVLASLHSVFAMDIISVFHV
jgi:hypothetical protein